MLDGARGGPWVYVASVWGIEFRPERKLQVSVRAEGPVKVLTVIDAGVHELPDYGKKHVGLPRQMEASEVELQPSDTLWRVDLYLAFVGVSLVDSASEELLYVSATDVQLAVSQGQHERVSNLQIGSVQLDNQLRDTVYPVMLSPTNPLQFGRTKCLSVWPIWVEKAGATAAGAGPGGGGEGGGGGGGGSKGKLEVEEVRANTGGLERGQGMKGSTSDAKGHLSVPVIQSPAKDSQSSARGGVSPVLVVKTMKWKETVGDVECYQYISMRVAPLRLEVEEEAMIRILGMVDSLVRRDSSRQDPQSSKGSDKVAPACVGTPAGEGRSEMASITTTATGVKGSVGKVCCRPSAVAIAVIGGPGFDTWGIRSDRRKVYIEALEISQIDLTVSFASAPWMPVESRGAAARGLLRAAGIALQRQVIALADVEGANVRLGVLKLNHNLTSWEAIRGTMTRHYTRQVLREVYKIVGSADFLGNPVGLVQNLGLGVWDFVSAPTVSLIQRPTQFTHGVAEGTRKTFEEERDEREAKARRKLEKEEAKRRELAMKEQEEEERRIHEIKAQKKKEKRRLEAERRAELKELGMHLTMQVSEMEDKSVHRMHQVVAEFRPVPLDKGKRAMYSEDDDYSGQDSDTSVTQELCERTTELHITEKRKRGPERAVGDRPPMESPAKRTPRRANRQVAFTGRMMSARTKVVKSPGSAKRKTPVKTPLSKRKGRATLLTPGDKGATASLDEVLALKGRLEGLVVTAVDRNSGETAVICPSTYFDAMMKTFVLNSGWLQRLTATQALTGVLDSPIRGAEKYGLPGALTGAAKGLMGVVARPTASVLELAGKTAQSIRNTARGIPRRATRVRPPRPIGLHRLLLPYIAEEAIGICALWDLDGGRYREEVLMGCMPTAEPGCFIVLTRKLLLFVRSWSYYHAAVSLRAGNAPAVPVGQDWQLKWEVAVEDVLHVDHDGQSLIITEIKPGGMRGDSEQMQQQLGQSAGMAESSPHSPSFSADLSLPQGKAKINLMNTFVLHSLNFCNEESAVNMHVRLNQVSQKASVSTSRNRRGSGR
ncbi:hypothetical protein CBR_g47051 [Chara braunii]|uniref:Intermembrane lipid transfer protein VPS13-like C-terminal domain-containing protein n=1 Tax=Chara braunii TaxID=69332 RepID=A0A388M1K2_CHABU|nr:hypothetical protein CBR_g47051 [Chara braunii]|eukprot:GBG88353.1 hypothetical protein CBR_g47051 [Chara braunii]